MKKRKIFILIYTLLTALSLFLIFQGIFVEKDNILIFVGCNILAFAAIISYYQNKKSKKHVKEKKETN